MIVTAVYLTHDGVHEAAVAAVVVVAVSNPAVLGSNLVAIAVFDFAVVIVLLVETVEKVEGVVAFVAVVINEAGDVCLAAGSDLAAGSVIVVLFGHEDVSFELQRMLSVVAFDAVSLQTEHMSCDFHFCQWFVWVPYCVWITDPVLHAYRPVPSVIH